MCSGALQPPCPPPTPVHSTDSPRLLWLARKRPRPSLRSYRYSHILILAGNQDNITTLNPGPEAETAVVGRPEVKRGCFNLEVPMSRRAVQRAFPEHGQQRAKTPLRPTGSSRCSSGHRTSELTVRMGLWHHSLALSPRRVK